MPWRRILHFFNLFFCPGVSGVVWSVDDGVGELVPGR
jgi:hypothetical protein